MVWFSNNDISRPTWKGYNGLWFISTQLYMVRKSLQISLVNHTTKKARPVELGYGGKSKPKDGLKYEKQEFLDSYAGNSKQKALPNGYTQKFPEKAEMRTDADHQQQQQQQ